MLNKYSIWLVGIDKKIFHPSTKPTQSTIVTLTCMLTLAFLFLDLYYSEEMEDKCLE